MLPPSPGDINESRKRPIVTSAFPPDDGPKPPPFPIGTRYGSASPINKSAILREHTCSQSGVRIWVMVCCG